MYGSAEVGAKAAVGADPDVVRKYFHEVNYDGTMPY